MINPVAISFYFVALITAPLLFGLINRMKSISAGRKGPPVFQTYFDLIKLLRKATVYSVTTTVVFRAGPIITLSSIGTALLMIPWGGVPAMLSFTGDFILVFYLLAVGRFFTIAAALDTGSSFEGMGASREAFFSALTEPVLFAVFITLVRLTEEMSLSDLYSQVTPLMWTSFGAVLILTIVILLILLLAENSRIPVDDPTTHLELTMIHEVMVLDHGGPDFGYALYASVLQLWIFSALIAGLIIPLRTGSIVIDGLAFLAGVFAVSIVVGIIESAMARLRLILVPRLLVGATAIAAVCIYLTLK